jgi:WD40 repeat protein
MKDHPSYLSGGAAISAFAVEPFESNGKVRAALAGEDGVVRVWTIPEEGIDGAKSEPDQVLKGQSGFTILIVADGIDKIADIAFHPTAKDLLTVLSNDPDPHLRLFDLSTGEESRVIDISASGAHNMSWSPDGAKVALASRDNEIIILDPRQDSSFKGKAHDSPRSFQMVWLSDTSLASVGFSKGSQRRLNLYKLDPSAIEISHSILLDIAPSVLFPHYDPDTSILYITGKGERSISAYYLSDKEPTKLPGYTGSAPQLGTAWFGKRYMDIKKVEVMRCLRLTSKTMEIVEWRIPRNRVLSNQVAESRWNSSKMIYMLIHSMYLLG